MHTKHDVQGSEDKEFTDQKLFNLHFDKPTTVKTTKNPHGFVTPR